MLKRPPFIAGLAHLRQMLDNLRHNRRGVAAVVVAVALPVTLTAIGAATDLAYYKVSVSQLQGVADSSATAARNKLDPFTPFFQQAASDEAARVAGANGQATAVAASDVVQGWWDITITNPTVDKFGPPIAGQNAGTLFSNAVRVTARQDHQTLFGSLLGVTHIAAARMATGYKCSNLDYPLTRIQDDVPAPTLPAIYMSWATPGHSANTSYYWQQPDGTKNPIFKFYSPYDGQDVSFVLTFYVPNNNQPYQMQVDTYCAGTYLVSPGEFDMRAFYNNNQPVTITATVQRGSTNNSFAVYSDPQDYPFAQDPTPYYTANAIPTPQYDAALVRTTTYPSANGSHPWVSEGNPTPDRRTLLVR